MSVRTWSGVRRDGMVSLRQDCRSHWLALHALLPPLASAQARAFRAPLSRPSGVSPLPGKTAYPTLAPWSSSAVATTRSATISAWSAVAGTISPSTPRDVRAITSLVIRIRSLSAAANTSSEPPAGFARMTAKLGTSFAGGDCTSAISFPSHSLKNSRLNRPVIGSKSLFFILALSPGHEGPHLERFSTGRDSFLAADLPQVQRLRRS